MQSGRGERKGHARAGPRESTAALRSFVNIRTVLHRLDELWAANLILSILLIKEGPSPNPRMESIVRMARLGALLVTAAALLVTAAAAAASALSAVSAQIALDLGSLPASSLLVVAPLASDVPAPRGDALAVELGMLIAGRMGSGVEAHGKCEPFSVARALASRNAALVYVQPEIARGQLRVAANVYPVLSNGWDRVRLPGPPPRVHAFASAPLDAEIRGYLPPIAFDGSRIEKAGHDFGDVLAIGCGDIDGDGKNELALVTRSGVAWGHVTQGRFVATHAAAWSALSPRSPVPMREPLGSSVVLPKTDGSGSALFVGTTDRGGVSVSLDLLAAAPLPGLPLPFGASLACGRVEPAASAYDGNPIDCANGTVAGDLKIPRYDAFSSAEIVRRDGKVFRAVAVRDPSGTLHLQDGRREETIPQVGAQVAVGDLDEDGIVEVVTTADGAGPDSITVASWRDGGLVARARIAAPEPVRALAVCPPEDARPRPLVAAVGAEVWIVR